MGKSQAMHMQQVSKTERHMTGQWKQRYISEKTAGNWGLGKALYENLEKLLKKMGILNMNACIASPAAESGHLTDDSYRFHKKMGFTLVGRFHNSGYKFGEWYDMIWMEKMIGEHEKDMPDVRFGQ